MMKIYSTRISYYSLLHREGKGWVFVCLLCLFVSCQSSPTLSPEEIARRDSAALHVALMPVADCLPFYVAQRSGIYERLGLDLRILTLQAQLDTDTALMRGRAELAYSDLARAIMLQQMNSTEIRAIAATEGELQLITTRKGRVRQLTGLKERMVAVARHSITDYWSDRLTDTAGLARADIFRPQINNVRIRTDMLCNGTMDAAFLPEPYATEAVLRGNRQNFSTQNLQPRLMVLLAPQWVLNDSMRCQQLRLLFQGYEEAAQALNEQRADSVGNLLKGLCLTPDTLIDSITRAMKHFAPLRSPEKADAEAALAWLRERGKVRKNYNTDSLIYQFHGE